MADEEAEGGASEQDLRGSPEADGISAGAFDVDPAEEDRFSNRFGASYTNMRVRFAREPLTVAETNKLVCVECDYLLTEFARTNLAKEK